MARRRSNNLQGAGAGGALLLLLVALIAVFLPGLSADAPQPLPGDPPVTQPAPVTEGFPGWMQVYFSNPNPPDDLANGLDQVVVPLIDSAQSSVELASFDLNLPSVLDALVRAKQRGVDVRVIIDTMSGETRLDAKRSPTGEELDAVRVLERVRIKVVDGGRSNGLMHNKFIVIDSRVLVTGSMNFSYNDTYRNNNNLLVITDPTLIANYRAKFNEGFSARRFGARAEFGAQVSVLNIDGVQVANYFSPPDSVMDKIVALTGTAQQSIRFMAFTYTHPDLINTMIARHQAGVDVQGIIEARGVSQGMLVPLYCHNVPVQVDGNRFTMHHKVIIIDELIVITGSYNFTKSADDANDENVLIIANRALAAGYLQEYNRLAAAARDIDRSTFTCP